MASKVEGSKSGWQLVEEVAEGEHSCRLCCLESGAALEVFASLGGAINSLRLVGTTGVTEVIVGYPSAVRARQETPSSFRGSPLFPWPNRLDRGTYLHRGKRYQLPLNFRHEKNAIHGLMYDQSCVLIDWSANQQMAELQLHWRCDRPMPGYPFTCEVSHKYTLDRLRGMRCETTVVNRDTLPIPVGCGWQPYVQLGGVEIDKLQLHLPPGRVLEVDERMIPTGCLVDASLFRDERFLGSTQLDHCLQLEKYVACLQTTLTDHQTGQALHLWQECDDGGYGYNYLQIYTPPDRHSLAIEPMTCAPNAFNNGMGLLLLPPGETVRWCWGICLQSRSAESCNRSG